MDKADSLSIQGQIDLCRQRAEGEVQVYQDRGYSGKNTNRPAFRRMMEDVERGLVRRILVYRLDRFSRSIADFGRLWEVLERHGVAFVSINETFDTATPMGRAMLNIIMVFAQLERETTAQRVRDNYYQRAALGAWPGGPAPYGFSVGRLPGPDGRPLPALVPDGRAPAAADIFRAYARPGATLGSVARALNEAGVPAPRRAVWDGAALSRLLHSPLYVMADREVYLYYQGRGAEPVNPPEAFDGRRAGMLVGRRDRSAGKYRDLRGQRLSLAAHGGLVPSGLWLQCQDKLEANRQLSGAGRGKHTWLSGLLRCACCGYSVKVSREGDRYRLSCSGRSNLKVCGASIRMELGALEQAAAAGLEALLAEGAAVPAEDRETARALAELDRRAGRLVAALAESGAAAAPYIDRAVRELEARRETVLARRPAGQPCPARRPFSALSFEEKKLAAALFIREIRLSGSRAEIFWRV